MSDPATSDHEMNLTKSAASSKGTVTAFFQPSPAQQPGRKSSEVLPSGSTGQTTAASSSMTPLAASILRPQLLHSPCSSNNEWESVRPLMDATDLTHAPLLMPFAYPNMNALPHFPILRDQSIFGMMTVGLPTHGAVPFARTNFSVHPMLSSFRGDYTAAQLLEYNRNAHLASMTHFNFQQTPRVSASTANGAIKSTQKRNGQHVTSRRVAQTLPKRPASISSSISSNHPPQGQTRQKQDNEAPLAETSLSLHIAEDFHKLNESQIFLRLQTEFFRATEEDILCLTRGKNKPIVLQQVGIRCCHCSHISAGRRTKGSTYFPSNLMGIYQACQNLSAEHLHSGVCPEVPSDVKKRIFSSLITRKPAASGVGKKYWADAGRKLGLVDTEDGIRFSADLGVAGEDA